MRALNPSVGGRSLALVVAFATSACVLEPPSAEGEATGDASTTTGNPCGPTEAVVDFVVDGDTIQLTTGERVRYLLVDTPETSPPAECFGPEAATFNEQLVEGKSVTLAYDAQCFDNFDRLLAYVSVEGIEVNSRLVERGYACVLHIPPNGNARVAEFENLAAAAEANARGMWGACASPCD